MVVSFPANVCAVFEILVMLFQVCGVMGLCLIDSRRDRRAGRLEDRWCRSSLYLALASRVPCAAATIRSLPCSPAGR